MHMLALFHQVVKVANGLIGGKMAKKNLKENIVVIRNMVFGQIGMKMELNIMNLFTKKDF